jgi:hypothetical protein
MSDEELIAHYSAALDEIYRLRSALAYEAGVTEAHLSYATFPKTRRVHGEEQVGRMREAAAGQSHAAYFHTSDLSLKHARREAGMPETLTRGEWEATR